MVSFPAFKHHIPGNSVDVDGQRIPYLLGGAACTSIFTLTGHPVVVIPIGQAQQGLPIRIQLVGKRWQDYSLLDLAKKIVEVVGTNAHPPGF